MTHEGNPLDPGVTHVKIANTLVIVATENFDDDEFDKIINQHGLDDLPWSAWNFHASNGIEVWTIDLSQVGANA
jgi:hypothetical protein